jgi:hypothetical protein
MRGAWRLALCTSLLIGIASPPAAQAANPPPESRSPKDVDVGGSGSRIGALGRNRSIKGDRSVPPAGQGGHTGGPVVSPVADVDPGPMVVDTEIRLAADGSQCAFVFRRPGEADSIEHRGAAEEARRAVAEYGACPDSPANPDGTPAVGGVVEQVWSTVEDLPAPSLWIAPGEAITGLPAYLEIGGDRERIYRFGPEEALGYTITIEVPSTYTVDWGDGTVERGITSPGGPYPHGDVRHVYQLVDADNVVTVTQEWQARWTAVGNGETASGEIAAGELETSAAFPLSVGQLQAVRNY